MGAEHWFVTYEDERDRRDVTTSWLSDGLDLGEQVGLFGWGAVEDLRRGLDGLHDVDELIEHGAARLTSLGEHFSRDAPPDPGELVRFWSDATDAALDAGFAGLRVVTDTTPWANLAHDQRAVFLRGEQLINRYRLHHPFTLICTSDASVMTPSALADTVCVHPSVRGESPPFRLYAAGDADVVLTGEVDGLSVVLFERALDTLPTSDGETPLVVDVARLDFIDHSGLLALERHAERHGWPAVLLRHPPDEAERLVDLLGLRRVRPEAPR